MSLHPGLKRSDHKPCDSLELLAAALKHARNNKFLAPQDSNAPDLPFLDLSALNQFANTDVALPPRGKYSNRKRWNDPPVPKFTKSVPTYPTHSSSPSTHSPAILLPPRPVEIILPDLPPKAPQVEVKPPAHPLPGQYPGQQPGPYPSYPASHPAPFMPHSHPPPHPPPPPQPPAHPPPPPHPPAPPKPPPPQPPAPPRPPPNPPPIETVSKPDPAPLAESQTSTATARKTQKRIVSKPVLYVKPSEADSVQQAALTEEKPPPSEPAPSYQHPQIFASKSRSRDPSPDLNAHHISSSHEDMVVKIPPPPPPRPSSSSKNTSSSNLVPPPPPRKETGVSAETSPAKQEGQETLTFILESSSMKTDPPSSAPSAAPPPPPDPPAKAVTTLSSSPASTAPSTTPSATTTLAKDNASSVKSSVSPKADAPVVTSTPSTQVEAKSGSAATAAASSRAPDSSLQNSSGKFPAAAMQIDNKETTVPAAVSVPSVDPKSSPPIGETLHQSEPSAKKMKISELSDLYPPAPVYSPIRLYPEQQAALYPPAPRTQPIEYPPAPEYPPVQPATTYPPAPSAMQYPPLTSAAASYPPLTSVVAEYPPAPKYPPNVQPKASESSYPPKPTTAAVSPPEATVPSAYAPMLTLAPMYEPGKSLPAHEDPATTSAPAPPSSYPPAPTPAAVPSPVSTSYPPPPGATAVVPQLGSQAPLHLPSRPSPTPSPPVSPPREPLRHPTPPPRPVHPPHPSSHHAPSNPYHQRHHHHHHAAAAGLASAPQSQSHFLSQLQQGGASSSSLPPRPPQQQQQQGGGDDDSPEAAATRRIDWWPLHKEIVDFTRLMTPSMEENQNMASVLDSIDRVAKSIWPPAQTHVFGSRAQGLCLTGSDADICILGVLPNSTQPGGGFTAKERTKLHRQLCVLLKALADQKIIKPGGRVVSATVPIIKCEDAKHEFDLDISLGGANGLEAVKEVRVLMQQFPPLRTLGIVMKAFLKQKKMNETFEGGVGSFVLVNMIVGYLQKYPFLFANSMEVNYGLLLVRILHFYGHTFPLSTSAISVKRGGIMSKTVVGVQNEPKLYVEDPQQSGKDCGKNAFRIRDVFEEMKQAAETLVTRSFEASIALRNVYTQDTKDPILKAAGSLLRYILQPEAVFLKRPLPEKL